MGKKRQSLAAAEALGLTISGLAQYIPSLAANSLVHGGIAQEASQKAGHEFGGYVHKLKSDRLRKQIDLLTELIVTMPARSTADALVQMMVAAQRLDVMDDPADVLDSEDQERQRKDIQAVKGAIDSALLYLVAETKVDLKPLALDYFGLPCPLPKDIPIRRRAA